MNRNLLAAIAIIEGLILIILLVNSLGLFNSLLDFQFFGCGGEIYATAQSPDKKLTAYALERDCGATTGSTTFIILRDTKEKLDLKEDLVNNEIIFEAREIYQPKLKWTSKHNLQVTFNPTSAPKAADISYQVVKQGDVAVDYSGLKNE